MFGPMGQVRSMMVLVRVSTIQAWRTAMLKCSGWAQPSQYCRWVLSVTEAQGKLKQLRDWLLTVWEGPREPEEPEPEVQEVYARPPQAEVHVVKSEMEPRKGVRFLVDSGADVHLIPQRVWE